VPTVTDARLRAAGEGLRGLQRDRPDAEREPRHLPDLRGLLLGRAPPRAAALTALASRSLGAGAEAETMTTRRSIDRAQARAALVTGLVLALAGGGCYRHLAVNAGTVPEAFPRSAQWHHHVLWGLVNLTEPEVLNAVCPQGVAQVYTRVTFFNWVLSVITGGVYSPTRVDVWCAQAGGAAPPTGPFSVLVRPTPEAVARWRRAFPDLEAGLREPAPAAPRALAAGRPAAPAL
jgi:hypothetical protein